MQINSYVQNQYQKFSKADGSQYIVSEYALSMILQLIQKFKPQKILEVGVGIGTISDSILKAFQQGYSPELFGTENDDFCLTQIPKNLGSSFSELKLFPTVEDLPAELKFDLIIIDGKDPSIQNLEFLINHGGILIIEGDRKDQVDMIEEWFPEAKFVHSIISKKNNLYSNRPKNHYQGGLKIIFTKPGLKAKVEWLKLKLSSKIHFQIRKYSG